MKGLGQNETQNDKAMKPTDGYGREMCWVARRLGGQSIMDGKGKCRAVIGIVDGVDSAKCQWTHCPRRRN